jgi:hypothetical protein
MSGYIRKIPSIDIDDELTNYDVELGLEELKKQLKDIESDKRKEEYDHKLEAFRLRQAIKKLEEGKNMPYEEFMKILRENSIRPLIGSYYKTVTDPESGEEYTVNVEYNNTFPKVSPKYGLRHRNPDTRSLSPPFMPISSNVKPNSRPTTPLLPSNVEEVSRKKSICEECIKGICPEGCNISGGIRRRRKSRKVRKSRKSKKSNKKSKRRK